MTNDVSPEFDAYETVLDTVQDPIWVVDRDYRYVFLNQFIIDHVEGTREEWIGRTMDELWSDHFQRFEHRDRLVETIDAILDGQITKGRTEVVSKPGDRSITRQVTSIPWTVDGTVQGVINVTRDLTDQKSRERQLKILDRVLRHNVRNEMGVITGNAQIIDQKASEEVSHFAETIHQTADRLLDTVTKERAIVDVIRKELAIEHVDLAEVIERQTKGLKASFPTATVRTELPDRVSARALEKIDRAIEELLENAVEHNDVTSPTIEVTVEPGTDYHRIRIEDDGPGIPDEEISVLTAAEIQPLYHGSGLGLWLVNWIVEESGGQLRFESREPRGSIVTIELPATE